MGASPLVCMRSSSGRSFGDPPVQEARSGLGMTRSPLCVSPARYRYSFGACRPSVPAPGESPDEARLAVWCGEPVSRPTEEATRRKPPTRPTPHALSPSPSQHPTIPFPAPQGQRRCGQDRQGSRPQRPRPLRGYVLDRPDHTGQP